MDTNGLYIDTVFNQFSLFLQLHIFSLHEFSKTPFFRDNDSLFTREFVFSSSQCFHSMWNILLGATYRIQWLSNINSGAFFHWLTISLSHTSLESIGTSAGQHFVDTDNVPRMNSASHVEGVFTSFFGHIFVSSNTGSFQSTGRNLFFFPRNHVNRAWEFIAISFFSTDIIRTNLRVRASSAISRLGIWLVFHITIATSRSSSHFRLY